MQNLLSVAYLCLVVSSTFSAPILVQQEKILFVSKKDGFYHLFIVRPDGTRLKQLTRGNAHHLFPAWSPDGKRIVCSVTQEGKQHLYVMNANGTRPNPLTNGPGHDRASAWSPDGKKIAFTRMGRDSVREIYSIDIATKKLINLTKSRTFDSDVTWSPDGKQTAFASDRAGDGFRVFVMNANGTNVRGLTKRGNGGLVYPAWSPSGKRLVYSDVVKGGSELFISNVDGSDRKQLTSVGGCNSYAAWSSLRGDVIFFQHHPQAGQDGVLYQVNVRTKKATPLRIDLPCPINGGRPAIQP